MELKKYVYGVKYLSDRDLWNASPDVQKDVMEYWFFTHFEDPANSMPYMDGEYHYLWGGPYYAEEELNEEFKGKVQKETIQKLVDELSGYGWQWAPTEGGDYYDEDYDEDYIFPYHNFIDAINNINMLLRITISNQNEAKYLECLHKLLYVNVITALETYLSDTFIKTIQSHKDLAHKFVGNKIMKEEELQKFKHYRSVSWHNTNKANKMYKNTLNVELFNDQEEKDKIDKVIKKRHDIVHRNGKNKDGDDIYITQKEILFLIAVVGQFVENIEEKIRALSMEKSDSADPPNKFTPDDPTKEDIL